MRRGESGCRVAAERPRPMPRPRRVKRGRDMVAIGLIVVFVDECRIEL